MLVYLLRRVLYTVPILLTVALACFLLIHIAPGDVINSILPPDAPKEVADMLRRTYGLDRPLPVQFWLWLVQVMHGDFGWSLATGRPVYEDLRTAVINTLVLAVAASLLSFVFGALIGGLASAFIGKFVDRAAIGAAIVGVSVPHYWLGMVMVVLFSVKLDWLPAIGMTSDRSGIWSWNYDHLQHLVLPALTMAVIPTGLIARSIRSSAGDVLNRDFILTLRGKGLGRFRIFLHVVKNAAPNVLAVMGLQLGYLMGGSILVETVFNWPGTGSLLHNAIFRRDLPVLQATILVLSLFFVLINVAVDLLQSLLDPRVRRG